MYVSVRVCKNALCWFRVCFCVCFCVPGMLCVNAMCVRVFVCVYVRSCIHEHGAERDGTGRSYFV